MSITYVHTYMGILKILALLIGTAFQRSNIVFCFSLDCREFCGLILLLDNVNCGYNITSSKGKNLLFITLYMINKNTLH